ncbi:hypothetical protein SFR_1280 [Streptomyces sp. FR-008]|nr:hypothetical protein SFR_1280 [Streptomyces sp. FR-008]
MPPGRAGRQRCHRPAVGDDLEKWRPALGMTDETCPGASTCPRWPTWGTDGALVTAGDLGRIGFR